MNDFQALCSALLENIILRKQLEFALQNTQSALKEAQTQLEGLTGAVGAGTVPSSASKPDNAGSTPDAATNEIEGGIPGPH